LPRLESNHPVQVRVMTEQRDEGLLSERSYPGGRVTETDGAEQGSDEENVADRAEAHGEDVWRGGVVKHGEKL
jgi:hypothetical protein